MENSSQVLVRKNIAALELKLQQLKRYDERLSFLLNEEARLDREFDKASLYRGVSASLQKEMDDNYTQIKELETEIEKIIVILPG